MNTRTLLILLVAAALLAGCEPWDEVRAESTGPVVVIFGNGAQTRCGKLTEVMGWDGIGNGHPRYDCAQVDGTLRIQPRDVHTLKLLGATRWVERPR